MRGVLQDITYFLRTVTKSPAFFAIAVLTLALGIGANTAVFSVINSVLLRPLPFDDPDRLVRLFETEAAPGNYPFAAPDYLDWQAQNRTLEGTALFSYAGRRNVSGGGQPDSALNIQTEVNFFSVLGARPLLGRTFARSEGGPGAHVAVVSYGFWQRFFGGDKTVVGKTIELNSEKHVVIGVMPSWFNYPRAGEIWTPLDMSPQSLGPRGSHSYQAIARLKRGVTVSQALADLETIARRLELQFPDSNEKVGASVVPMKEQLAGSSREPLLILLGAVALVLLVACANVANLLLIRAGGRRRELAIRAALGAGRWRVARQLLTESTMLAIAGAVAGLGLAWWGVRLLASIKSLPVPLANPIRIDSWVLLFTLGVAIATGLLFGVLPALQASAIRLADELKSGSQTVAGGGSRTRRLRDAIAVAEIALSLALLIGAGLLLRSFDKMRNAEFGVNTRSILTTTLDLPTAKYADLATRRAFFDNLVERLRSTPGVEAVSVSMLIPLEGGSNGYITVPGRDAGALRNQLFEYNYVTPDYFRVFGIPVLRGRNFTAQDEQHAAETSRRIDEIYAAPNPQRELLRGLTTPVVITRAMARMVWPNEDPIGKTFHRGSGVASQVIGVVGDVKIRGIRSENLPGAYYPHISVLGDVGRGTLALRTKAAPMSLLPSVRAHVGALDSGLALVQPRTMDDVVADGMADTSLQTSLLGAFAVLAVVLAGVGLYSVMTFLVAQRKHEIGIRVAMGAARSDLLRLVLGHATKLVGVGLLAGLAAAFWLSRLLRGLLFGVTASDPWTFAAVSIVLALIALAACVVPARRATRVDPIIALRYE